MTGQGVNHSRWSSSLPTSSPSLPSLIKATVLVKSSIGIHPSLVSLRDGYLPSRLLESDFILTVVLFNFCSLCVSVTHYDRPRWGSLYFAQSSQNVLSLRFIVFHYFRMFSAILPGWVGFILPAFPSPVAEVSRHLLSLLFLHSLKIHFPTFCVPMPPYELHMFLID